MLRSPAFRLLVNEELGNVLKYYAANILSINLKKDLLHDNILTKEENYYQCNNLSYRAKSQIKYLSVLIDEHLKMGCPVSSI